jgi:hypothetical protein
MNQLKTLAGDAVQNPPHYKGNPSGIECIDVVEHLNFNRGNAIKYLWRAGLKGDSAKEVEDLEKALWYVTREIDRLKVNALDAVEADNLDADNIDPSNMATMSADALADNLSAQLKSVSDAFAKEYCDD